MLVTCPNCFSKMDILDVWPDHIVMCERCLGYFVPDPNAEGDGSAQSIDDRYAETPLEPPTLPPLAKPKTKSGQRSMPSIESVRGVPPKLPPIPSAIGPSADEVAHQPAPDDDRAPDDLPADDGPVRFRGIKTSAEHLRLLAEEARVAGNSAKRNFIAAYVNAKRAMKRDSMSAAVIDWSNAHELLRRVEDEHTIELIRKARRQFVRLASRQLLGYVKRIDDEFKAGLASGGGDELRRHVGRIAIALRRIMKGRNKYLVLPKAHKRMRRTTQQWMRDEEDDNFDNWDLSAFE